MCRNRTVVGAAVGLAALAAIGPASAQSLGEAAQLALSSNPAVMAERSRLEAAGEGRAQALAQRRASAQADASAGLAVNWADNIFGQRTRTETDPVTGQIQIAQPIYTGGRARAAMDSAEAAIAQAEAALISREVAVLRDVAQAYLDIRRDEETVRIRNNNLMVLNRQLEAARARFEVGEITRTDVALAEARVAQAQTGIAAAQGQLEISRAAYRRTVGDPPGTLSTPPELSNLPATLDGALIEAERLSPLITGARAQEAQAAAGVRSAEAEHRARATLALGANGALNQQRDGSESYGGSLVARVTVPLWTGGFNDSRVRQFEAQESAARLLVMEQSRIVAQQVTSAWQQLQAARAAILSNRAAVRANEIAFEGAELELQVGLRTTVDVLDQEQDLLESRLALATSERDAYVAGANLLAAMGALDLADLGVAAAAPERPQLRAARATLFEQPLIAVQHALEAVRLPQTSDVTDRRNDN
jgi:outer membrane protein